MSLLHRNSGTTVVNEQEPVRQDIVEPAVATRTRERAWTFAPGQIVSLVVGVGAITIGLVAVIRAGIDGSLSEPVVQVLGYTHTAWLGIGEIVVGLLLLLAGLDARSRGISVFLGTLAVIAGVLVLAEPARMPDELGLEKDFGWPLIVLGAVVALAALALPVWHSHRVDRDAVGVRQRQVV